MKKVILTMVAVCALSSAFAGNTDKKVNSVELNVNVYKLQNYLGFSPDEYVFVSDVMERLNDDLKHLDNLEGEKYDKMLKKAVMRNLAYMRDILSSEQYSKYLVLLNTTLRNKGIEVK